MRICLQGSLLFFLLFIVKPFMVQAQTASDSLNDTILVAEDSLEIDLIPDPIDSNEVLAIPDEEDLLLEDELNDTRTIHFSLESPYHAIVSHLYFLQPETYWPDSSAMTLYVQDPESEAAQQLAIQLKEYLDGAGYFIDIDALPDDPDYIDSVSGRHLYLPVPEIPQIFVYKKRNSDDWIYSYSTVKAIPELHRGLFPFGTLDWLPEWTHERIGGLKIWQWMGLLIYLILAVLIHRLLTGLISFFLQRFLKRFITHGHTEEFFLKIARPISLLILFYIIFGILPALQLPIALNKWVVLAFRVMIPIFWMMIALQVVNLVMAIFARRAENTDTTLDDQLVPLLRRLGHVIVVIVFAILILNVLSVNVNALLGGLAFGSLAFALAAQDTVKNLFGSILIFTDRPFQIGDWVVVDGHEGVVEEVSVRSTRIRTFRGSLITIPNGNLADSAIDNVGVRPYRRFVTRVGLTYDTPPDLIEVYVEGLRELIRNHPTTRKDYFEVHFNEMADFNLQILVYTFFDVKTWTEELAGRQYLLLGIMRLAEELGINFAFPTQTLHIDNFPERETRDPNYADDRSTSKEKTQRFIQRWKENYVPRDLGQKADKGGEG